MKINQEMKFPFQLTNATLPKCCDIERFRNPPTDSKEEHYQAYFINACSKLPNKRVSVEDTHKFPVLLMRKPDCVTIDEDHGLDPVVPTTAGEQKVIDTWDLTSLDGAWLPPIQVKCLGYS